jgi:hypothetical protein
MPPFDLAQGAPSLVERRKHSSQVVGFRISITGLREVSPA